MSVGVCVCVNNTHVRKVWIFQNSTSRHSFADSELKLHLIVRVSCWRRKTDTIKRDSPHTLQWSICCRNSFAAASVAYAYCMRRGWQITDSAIICNGAFVYVLHSVRGGGNWIELMTQFSTSRTSYHLHVRVFLRSYYYVYGWYVLWCGRIATGQNKYFAHKQISTFSPHRQMAFSFQPTSLISMKCIYHLSNK